MGLLFANKMMMSNPLKFHCKKKKIKDFCQKIIFSQKTPTNDLTFENHQSIIDTIDIKPWRGFRFNRNYIVKLKHLIQSQDFFDIASF